MKLFCINLDRATERRAFMEKQAESLGLAMERLPAVEAARISDETQRAIGRQWERPLTKPELGCFLSHHALWQRIASSEGPALILEDDVVLSARLAEALSSLQGLEGFDLVNIESYGRRKFVAPLSTPIRGGLRVVRVMRDKSGSGAYLLWPSGARKLLRRAERGAAPADAFLHGTGVLKAGQVEPALAVQAHILAERGVDPGIETATSIHAPRRRLSLHPRNWPFHARRVAAQLKLLGLHAGRLGFLAFREIDLDEADFRMSQPERQSLS